MRDTYPERKTLKSTFGAWCERAVNSPKCRLACGSWYGPSAKALETCCGWRCEQWQFCDGINMTAARAIAGQGGVLRVGTGAPVAPRVQALTRTATGGGTDQPQDLFPRIGSFLPGAAADPGRAGGHCALR